MFPSTSLIFLAFVWSQRTLRHSDLTSQSAGYRRYWFKFQSRMCFNSFEKYLWFFEKSLGFFIAQSYEIFQRRIWVVYLGQVENFAWVPWPKKFVLECISYFFLSEWHDCGFRLESRICKNPERVEVSDLLLNMKSSSKFYS